MSPIVHIDSLLDEVVHQFSDPMSFLRELVQNAIDAGTGSIEVHTHHTDGFAHLSVADFGSGMTREIIETRLVTLFSSCKDDDLTKIGRFGIGFASVFAIEPDAVLVDTGREGRFWRVLFAPDRTYELLALDQPIEGTTITVIKAMDAQEFADFTDRVRDSLHHWCRFAEVPISFKDHQITAPFTVSGPFQATHEEDRTRIVIALAKPDETFAGFYNRGLTLMESDQAHQPSWRALRFRIDSPYLEHTLTRDRLLEDDHFQRARALIDRLATEDLPTQLIEEIQGALHDPDSHFPLDDLYDYLGHLLQSSPDLVSRYQRAELFLDLRGTPHSLRSLRRLSRRGRLDFLGRLDDLYQPIIPRENRRARRTHYLRIGRSKPLRSFLTQFLNTSIFLFDDQHFIPGALFPDSLDATHQTLAQAITDHWNHWLPNPPEVFPATFHALPPDLHDRIALCIRGDLDAPILPFSSLSTPVLGGSTPSTRHLLNTDHPAIQALTQQAHDEPEWAALATFLLIYDQDAPAHPSIDYLVRLTLLARARRHS